MTIIEQIKAEIERRICSIENCPFVEAEFGAFEKRDGKLIAYKDLLSFLSTFESEKSVPKDLEEAAKEYEKKHTYQRYDGGGFTPEYDATLAEAFIAGYNLCKEQMMKEAIPCKVFWHDGSLLDYTQEQQDNALERIGANVGDKVKIIIIKED